MLKNIRATTLMVALLSSYADGECLGTVASFSGACNLDSFRTAIASTTCTDAQLFGEEDASEVIQGLCEYDAPVQFVEIQGTYQADRRYFAGGGSLVDSVESWEARSAQIKRFSTNLGRPRSSDLSTSTTLPFGKALISWPEYLARIDYNAANGLGDNGYPANMNLETSCALQTAMCCFTDDSNGADDGFASETTTDVCRHDLANSPQSNHIKQGWSVFHGTEAPVHCVGFTWESEDDLIGNMMYDISLSQTAEKGYLKGVPGAPMCGCIEHMPVVEKAACRTAKLAEGTDITYTFHFNDDELSASNTAVVEYADCPNGDLAAEYEAVHGNESIRAHLVGEEGVDGGVGCADDTEEYLNDEQFLHVGRHSTKYIDVGPEWSDLVVGEGTRFLPPDIDAIQADATFRDMVNEDCGGRKCIVRRVCDSCSAKSHQDIYYQRVTELPSPGSYNENGEGVFDAAAGQVSFLNTFMNDWFDNVQGLKFNVLGVDFNLYSSYEDAKADTNRWTHCNYNDVGVGFPRDCGPKGYIWHQWNAFSGRHNQATANNNGFYVEEPQAQG